MTDDHDNPHTPPVTRAPGDADLDLAVPAQRREGLGRRLDVLGAIAVGGVLGAEARYGLGVAMPHTTSNWPWATLLINTSGCFLIGVLMVVITELTEPHRLVRPFLGVGILGGYTTFSTYSTDILGLLTAGRIDLGLTYLAVTPAAALLAVWAASVMTRAAATVARRTSRPSSTGSAQ